jgi:hypothetical protein
MTMNFSKSLLVLISLVIAAGLWSLWHQQRAGLSPVEGPVHPDPPPALKEEPLAAPALAVSKRTDVVDPLRGGASPLSGQAEKREAEEEPKTGVIHGKIIDSRGGRLDQGRVLVFNGRDRSEPLATLELEGPGREYRIELPAKDDYWLVADPSSLGGTYVPPFTRSRGAVDPTQAEQLEFDDPARFSRQYVALAGGQEVRQDLEVGSPALLTGRLLGSDGRPAEGVLARLTGLDPIIVDSSDDCITDQEGIFTIAEIYPGNHRLVFSRKEPWDGVPARDLEIEGGETRNLGDIHAGGGQRTVFGYIVDQDDLPFEGLEVICYSNQSVKEGLPSHAMNSVLGRATSDPRGFFELTALPAIPVKVYLTSSYEPGKVGGAGHAAYWEHPVLVDLESSLYRVDVGTHTVEESRPFEITGRIVFDEGWLAGSAHRKRELEAYVSQVQGKSLPDGVRRPTLRRKGVELDPETDVYRCLVETPMTEIEIHFRLKGYLDLVYTVQPEALESWEREIRVPWDFDQQSPETRNSRR